MRHDFVNSSSLQWAEYDEDEKVLTLKFASGGEYKYEEVPFLIYEDLINAQSAGKYFQSNIRNKFKVAE